MELSDINVSRIFAISALLFGAISVLLASIGLGTPQWQTTYTYATGSAQISSTNSFFSACSYSAGSLVACQNRDNTFTYYAFGTYYTGGIFSANNDTTTRFNSAAGLSIIGIIFTAFGGITSLIMIFAAKLLVVLILGPVFYLLGCLFMLAGLAQGSSVLLSTGYSASLYQTAHMLTMVGFGLSCVAATRLHALKSV